MAGTMNTRKQVEAARNSSIKEIKSGKWKREFDKTIDSYLNELDVSIKENQAKYLRLLSLQWGLSRYPELKQYANEKLIEIGIQPKSEKNTFLSYDELNDEEKRRYNKAVDRLRSISKVKATIEKITK